MIPLLRVDDVHVSYGRTPALRGVSFVVRAGELVSFLGPNGAGKTTLLRAISGLAPISQGFVELSGRDITKLNTWKTAQQGIAHVPQGRRCFVNLTVAENLALGARKARRAEIKDRVASVCKHFPMLAEKSRQLAGQLSGGQQQMLAVARALMSQPTVLLIDEPSLGLAPAVVKSLGPILTGLAGETGTAVILAEQNVGLASACTSTTYVLRGGVCVLSGPVEEIKPRLMSLYSGKE
jgi:branched-chain amino acid transport system ATP-binding protein